jgi:phospholipid-binding lipoprotein MlaA
LVGFYKNIRQTDGIKKSKCGICHEEPDAENVMIRKWMPFLGVVVLASTVAFGANAQMNDYLDEDMTYEEGKVAAGAAETPDPIEGFNRAIHGFNRGVDTVVLRPASKAYEFVVPEPGRKMVHNALENWESPVIFANSILQGDPQNTFVTFWRFAFNTTLGVGGLFDIASELGMPERNNEDFGQTLGTYGVGQGFYLVLPILGPSSLRDGPSRVVDWFFNPLNWSTQNWERIAINATDAVDTRYRYGNLIDNIYDDSLDPYATFRSLYLQRRVAEVNNTRADQAPGE